MDKAYLYWGGGGQAIVLLVRDFRRYKGWWRGRFKETRENEGDRSKRHFDRRKVYLRQPTNLQVYSVKLMMFVLFLIRIIGSLCSVHFFFEVKKYYVYNDKLTAQLSYECWLNFRK